jgi:hypothetical protein
MKNTCKLFGNLTRARSASHQWRAVPLVIIALAALIGFSMAACDNGTGPSNTGNTGGGLTVTGLPGGGTYAVYVFTTGVDISTFAAVSSAFTSGSYQAVGATANGNVFALIGWNGTATTTAFTGSGSLPVLLLNSSGSSTDLANPMYRRATVGFTNGGGTVQYGSFTAVVQGGGTGGSLTVVTIAAIPGVTPPATGQAPVTTVGVTAQYTGAVLWSPLLMGTFAAYVPYTATITLNPSPGYTFAGVAADFFTVAGATSARNARTSAGGTAVFPATGAPPSLSRSRPYLALPRR